MSSTYRAGRYYENLNKGIFKGAGEYEIPRLLAEQSSTMQFISFNQARRYPEKERVGVHFFIDDYQFERVWKTPDTYLNQLRQFACVFTPDFSVYTDFPKIVQIYNHYRKHWLGAYWQQCGITVIPTIAWSDEDSFAWCFDGEPEGGDVAVSSVGTQKNKAKSELFLAGYNEMLRRLHPRRIFFHGIVPEGCSGNIVPIATHQNKFRKG